MRTSFLFVLIALNIAMAMAQSATWDVHPLNTVPCTEWIYPAAGCGGCSSCRMAIDTDPSALDGGYLYWSDDLVICPHPLDANGNVVLITDWPVEADPGSYLFGRVELHQNMHIDTVEVIAAKGNGGPDAIEIAVQYNVNDPLQTSTLLQGTLTNQLQAYTATDLGCAPMLDASTGWANIYVRAHGGDLGFLFKQLRVVASPCVTASVAETRADDLNIRVEEGGVNITTTEPTSVSICDALGRITYSKSAALGNTFAPLSAGLNIVRVGNTTKRIVR